MLVDVGADPCMGHAGQELDERFYQADRVHLNGYGARTVAGLVAAALYAQHLGLWTEA
jgi:lysophospholipase L1-like esterase